MARRAYLILLATALLAISLPADAAPKRSVATIAWAIAESAGPRMPLELRKRYARAIKTNAEKHSYDPFTQVSIIAKEASWLASGVSGDYEDIGFGQIRARYIGACKTDPNPVPIPKRNAEREIVRDENNQIIWVARPGPACQAVRRRLKDGVYNIGLMATQITAWRKRCRKETGRPALLYRMLAAYGGLSRPKLNRWCGMERRKGKWADRPIHRNVLRIINHRKMLLAKLRARRKRGRASASR